MAFLLCNGKRCVVLKKFVTQQLLQGRSFPGIHLEHFKQQIPSRFFEPPEQPGGLILALKEKRFDMRVNFRLEEIALEIGGERAGILPGVVAKIKKRPAYEQLSQNAAQTPDVHGEGAVHQTRSKKLLWSAVEKRGHGLHSSGLWLDEGSTAKVCDHNLPLFGNENVGGLQIPVDSGSPVHLPHSFADLFENSFHFSDAPSSAPAGQPEQVVFEEVENLNEFFFFLAYSLVIRHFFERENVRVGEAL